MGTARAPVAASGFCPAWRERVAKPNGRSSFSDMCSIVNRATGTLLRRTPLRFQCQPGCTACCEQQGFVYLTEDDIPRIAAFLGLSATAFEERYVYRTK